ncbi:hypothetical protein [Hirschia litorea]|uniref:Uncharacterized protein n=1 Tax=Hirschia litorea TaxID=1199156 RepID=A0ABW2IM05_9PROT
MGFDATGGKPYKGGQDSPIWYAVIGVVVVLCFGLVWLGPKIFGSKQPSVNLTISELVEGRSIPEAAGLLNEYGFQDELTKSVLVKMRHVDEIGHAKLLTKMAENAQAGVSKTELSMMILDWSKRFAHQQAETIYKADISYFDQFLLLLSEVSLGLQAQGETACELGGLYRISQNPDLSSKYMYYDSPYYQFSMRATLLMLGAVEGGLVAPQSYGELTDDDRAQLSELVMMLAANPEGLKFLDILLTPPAKKKKIEPAPDDAAVVNLQQPDVMIIEDEHNFDGVNVCEQADSLIAGFQALPVETRARYWAAGFKE